MTVIKSLEAPDRTRESQNDWRRLQIFSHPIFFLFLFLFCFVYNSRKLKGCQKTFQVRKSKGSRTTPCKKKHAALKHIY